MSQNVCPSKIVVLCLSDDQIKYEAQSLIKNPLVFCPNSLCQDIFIFLDELIMIWYPSDSSLANCLSKETKSTIQIHLFVKPLLNLN